MVGIQNTKKSDVLVIGIGNRFRKDDAFGIVAAEEIKKHAPEEVAVVTGDGDPAWLLANWEDAKMAVVLDAVSSGSEPGTIFRIDVGRDVMPRSFFHCSTHALGLGEAVELGRITGQLPGKLVIYGVEIGNVEISSAASGALSWQVKRAMKQVIKEVKELCTSFHS